MVLVVVRHIRTLERYRYTFLLLGVAALIIPLLPGVGREINGARLWVRIGPLNFQPGEAAKVLLVIFFAAYLVDKRELLRSGTRRFLGMALPDPKHLGPLLLAWGFSILVMVRQKDLGSSLLFFAVFAAMLYIATERGSYLIVGVRRCSSPARWSRTSSSSTCRIASARGSTRGRSRRTTGFQIVQSMYAFGSGGFAGTGLGLGSPQKIPNASTDFVFSAIGEELGLIGTIAVCILFLLFVGSGIRIAVQADRPFSKLFAAGLTTIIGVQTFVIIGGVIRVIPLTGVTLPFISYGGSSLVANFVIVALLLRISDETVARLEQPGAVATAAIGGDGVAVPTSAAPRCRNGGPGEPRDPASGLCAHRGDPRARRAAHVSAGDRRQQPRQRPEQHPQVPARRQPSTRRDPHRRRPDRGAVTPDHRRAEVPARVPAGRAVQRDQRVPVVRRRQHRRRSQLQQRAHRARLDSSTSARSSPARTTPATSCSRRPPPPQQTAGDALGGQKGSVVALDIRTGEVLAMYSNPTFDPNPLAGHDTEKVNTSYFLLNADTAKPSLPRAYRERYPPGSTFKVVTAGGAIMTGKAPAGSHLSTRRRSRSRARPPGSATSAGRRAVVGRSPRASSNRATRPSRGSATRWATSSCPS